MKIETIESLDKRLITAETSVMGLASGKVGHCLYFYHKARITGNKDYEQYADKLIDEIVENIDSVKEYDIKNGLLGIGLCIHYLIDNEYVEGNSNEILKDIDSELFRQLCKTEPIDFKSLLQKQRQRSGNELLFRDVIVQGINNASGMIAKYCGRSYLLQNLRERSFITREGVSMLGISDML
jgi:hypothetical protein